MIICSGMLIHRYEGHDFPVEVRFHECTPLANGTGYACVWEVVWPNRVYDARAEGSDTCHALYLAFCMAGSYLYASEAHEAGELFWMEPGSGFGFPVPRNVRHELVGMDRDWR